MGTKKFGIQTFHAFKKPIVEFQKRVLTSEGQPLQISPGKEQPEVRGFNSFSIDIHEIEIEGHPTPIREITKDLIIEVTPDWIDKENFDKAVVKMLNKGEKASEVLSLNVRLICPKLNYVIDSRNISLEQVTNKTPLSFNKFQLEDVSGKIEIQSEVIRTKNSNPTTSFVAFANHTILSKNRPIAFYIDPIQEIGGNALPIHPGDIGSQMFKFSNISSFGVNPPELIYNKDFKPFFNSGDDYDSVQTILLLIGPSYCENLLKWIIYGKPDYSKNEHQVIIRFIGDFCEVREKDLEELTNEADYQGKSFEYLKLSSRLFDNLQHIDKGWSKILLQIIRNEKDGKA